MFHPWREIRRTFATVIRATWCYAAKITLFLKKNASCRHPSQLRWFVKGVRIVYHRQQYTQISERNRHANTILATVNRRVTNPQIQLRENPLLIKITPGRTRVHYKLTSVIDEKKLHTVVIHPAAARGQDLPPNISVDIVRAAIMDSLGENAIRRALGPSHVFCQLSNIALINNPITLNVTTILV
jgi:hypothetical protein